MHRRWLIVGGGVVFLLLASAPVAHAVLSGPCTGQGTFESQGRTYEASTSDKLVLPAKDSVAYTGTIDAAQPEGRSHRGEITLKLPPPLPSIAIADWSDDDTDALSDTGTYDYDLPFIVPRGVTLNLEGEHVDTAGTCTGSVEVEIEGGPFTAPLPTVISFALTIGAGSMAWVAGKAR